MNKNLRTIGFVLLAVLMIATTAFLIWASDSAQPEEQAINSMNSSQTVDYKNINRWLVFTPVDPEYTTGLILYPGGRVDNRAYAPHAKAIAEAGFTVVVVPMPLNLAFLGFNRASDVIQVFPEINQWVIGGHSLGGAMAAEFAGANPTLVEGLVLWASYPAASNDLSKSGLAVLSIFASNDGLATIQDIERSQALLPEVTSYIEIQGGNHAGFGWYGPQKGDGLAEISKADQQEQIVQATIELLLSLEK